MPFTKGNKLGSLNKGHPYYPPKTDRKLIGKKISESKKGVPLSKKNREALQKYWESKKGTTHSWGDKISRRLRGRAKTEEHIKHVADANRGKKHPSAQGEKHPAWKGDGVHYDGLHDWVARYRGRAKECSVCGLNDPTRTYHWANISGEYKRELKDWIRLCVPCHREMDKNRDDLNRIWKKVGNAYVRR